MKSYLLLPHQPVNIRFILFRIRFAVWNVFLLEIYPVTELHYICYFTLHLLFQDLCVCLVLLKEGGES